MSYINSMSSNTPEPCSSTDSVFERLEYLARQIPKAERASEIFVLFLEQVEKIFPFLIQVSIFLLPKDFTAFSRAQATGMSNGTKLPSFVHDVGNHDADSSVRQFMDKVLSFRFVNKLDWTNCSVFHLSKPRGAVAQAPPPWPVSCTSAYHAAIVATDIITTNDYDKHGPHFSDWRHIREQLGGRSMLAVPMCSHKQVVAVCGMASSVTDAFQREDVAWMVSQVLSGCVNRLLQYSNRRSEMRCVVDEIISPLASEISLHVAVDKELASEESFSIGKAKVRKQWICVQETPSKNGNKRRDLPGIAIEDVSPPDAALTERVITRPALKFCVPSYSKKPTRFSFEHICSADLHLSWSDFVCNLLNLCFVYNLLDYWFSRVSVHGQSQTYWTIPLCVLVAMVDIVLLLVRWIWFDQSFAQRGVIMIACQLYRVVVVPMANTWMSWKVLSNLDFQPDFYYVLIFATLVCACIVFGSQFPFLLHAPLQMLSIIFAALSTPAVCHQFDPTQTYSFLCLGSFSALQVLLAYLIPTLVLPEPRRGDTAKSGPYIAHQQVKRVSY